MSNTEQNKPARARISFAAIDPYIDTNIILPVEKFVPAKDLVEWGTRRLRQLFIRSVY